MAGGAGAKARDLAVHGPPRDIGDGNRGVVAEACGTGPGAAGVPPAEVWATNCDVEAYDIRPPMVLRRDGSLATAAAKGPAICSAAARLGEDVSRTIWDGPQRAVEVVTAGATPQESCKEWTLLSIPWGAAATPITVALPAKLCDCTVRSDVQLPTLTMEYWRSGALCVGGAPAPSKATPGARLAISGACGELLRLRGVADSSVTL